MCEKFFDGYARKNGGVGVRNNILVLYTVNCSAFVAKRACAAARAKGIPAQVIGNGSCFDSQVVINRMLRLIAHGNVGAVLVVGHGCEFIQAAPLAEFAHKQGKPVEVVMDQKLGTEKGIEAAAAALSRLWKGIRRAQREEIPLSRLVVGITQTAGSKYRSAAPLLGELSDRLVNLGAAVLTDGFDGDKANRDSILSRVRTEDGRQSMRTALDKLERFREVNGPVRGKSAYAGTGTAPFRGVLPVTMPPACPGLWFVDTLQDTNLESGFASASAADRAVDLITSGAHVVLLGLGNGAVVGTAVSPVVTVSADAELSSCFPDEIDCQAGHGRNDVPCDTLMDVIGGGQTVSERLGVMEGALRALA